MSVFDGSQLDIRPLGVGEEPERALFYVLDETRRSGKAAWKHGEPADGIAFLVNASGMLVTAAHVVWMADKFPGDFVQVSCILPSISILAAAQVLSVGWRGPEADRNGRMPKLPGREDLLDERADVVKEDIALLRIVPESIEVDLSRGGDKASVEDMVSGLRVMPLGVPGYKPLEGTIFTAWCVERHFKAPRMVLVNGRFRVHERAQHSAFQIEAPEIRPGFSGSPVWDATRRLAVGFVRSGASRRLAGAVRCTDARAIRRFAGVPMVWDADLKRVSVAANGLVTSFLGSRHEYSASGGTLFIEPRARGMRKHLDMGLSDTDSKGLPVLELLREELTANQMVCLCGGPGAGKSTALRRFAQRMLEDSLFIGGVPCIPLIFDARELPEAFDLDNVFGIATKRVGGASADEHLLTTALERNDASVVLLIDGLDETLEGRQVARLLAHCQGLLGGFTRVFRVLFTSRPDAQILSQPMVHTRPLTLVELLSFDSSQIEEYAEKRMSSEEVGGKFLTALRRVDWHQSASPLQLQMASTVFEIDGRLPARESDLAFEYVRLRVEQATRDFGLATTPKGIPLRWRKLYRPAVYKVLQALALVSLKAGSQTSDQIEESLKGLKGTLLFSAILARPKECLEFVFHDLISKVGLVSIERRADGDRLAWEHSTFIDVIAAEARLAIAGDDAAAVAGLVDRRDSSFSERFVLTQLSAMDRAGWEIQVAARVEQAMEAPFTDRKEGLFALRALAVGVRLPPNLRNRLVALLIRLALSPKSDVMLCQEVFSDAAGLPRARDILQRDELRADVIAAMRQRFWLRNPRRRGHAAPVIVSRGEASLLDLLQLWNEWLPVGLELAPPGSGAHPTSQLPGPSISAPMGWTVIRESAVVDRGGFEIVHRDSSVSTFEMPARSFLEGVAAMAQNLPPSLPPSHIVSLYLKGIAQSFDGDSARGEPPQQDRQRKP